jgi:IclR family KDG regulon transcriptional repressor
MRESPRDLKLVNSICRAAEIIRCLNRGENRLTDICRKLNLSKSTVHRLLKTLEISGFAIQDPLDRRYYFGRLLIDLASNYLTQHQILIMTARDEMSRLREISGETVIIQVRIGIERIFVEELQSYRTPRLIVGKGYIAPLQTGSGGKLLLSEIQHNDLEKILKSMSLGNKKNNIDIESLVKELEVIRKRGYAKNVDETLGSASISVPIKNYACPVALTILAPKDHLSNVTSVLPELKKSAMRISQRLSKI